jgi:glycerate-2-kinase
MCSNTDWHAVNDRGSKATAPSITARPTAQEKRLFAAIAAKRQLSESALALIAIRSLIDSDVPGLRAHTSSSGPALDRLTIRLRPGDRLAIRHRAAERRMKDSAYIAALVRGHLAANPPLATHELAEFKAAVSILAAFGRILARTAREAAQAGVLPRDLQQEISRSRALVADVERHMHEFAQAALVTWESRVD